MKTALLLLNGDEPIPNSAREKFSSADFVVCADGGAKIAHRLNLKPSIIIGDFDSIPKKVLQHFNKIGVPFLRFPKEKNETDAELALRFVVKQKVKNLFIYGFLGKRVDHFLSILSLPLKTEFSSLSITLISNNQQFYYIRKQKILIAKPGNVITLIPLVKTVFGITTTGLKYPLNNENLTVGSSRGVSNVFCKKKALIKINKGILLAVVTTKN